MYITVYDILHIVLTRLWISRPNICLVNFIFVKFTIPVMSIDAGNFMCVLKILNIANLI